MCVCVPSRNQDDNFLTRAAPQPDADFLWWKSDVANT